MPFNIVQSIERGAIYLEVVPAYWTPTDDSCFWPRSGLKTKQQDENCRPDDSFYSLSCVVKRKNLPTYKMAQEIVDVMTQQSDSDKELHVLKAKNTNSVRENPDLRQLIVVSSSIIYSIILFQSGVL